MTDDHFPQGMPAEVHRLLCKISDLAYDEDVGEPLDDAIGYANKAIALINAQSPAGNASNQPGKVLTPEQVERLQRPMLDPRDTIYAVAWQKRRGDGAWLNITVNKPEDLPEELAGLRKAGFELRPLYAERHSQPDKGLVTYVEYEHSLKDRAQLRELLQEAVDRGLIYWEPQTTRGAMAKADMVARINKALGRPA